MARPERVGQARPGAAGQRQRDPLEHPAQKHRPAGIPRRQPSDLLGERGGRAARVGAEEPARSQPQQHPAAADRRVCQRALIAAMHPG
jgi:hypothetical protein